MMEIVMVTPLEMLLDKQEIYEVLMRYCRALDRGDAEELAKVYHEDGIDDHGFWKGRGVEFAKYITEMLAGQAPSNCQHAISNVLIELDGQTAYVESYFAAVNETKGTRTTVHGRYIDRFEKRKGEWRIAYRVVARDVHRKDLVSPSYGDDEWVRRTSGKRDRTDALYHIRDMHK
jgi:ketosteroid isomerase-like protein